MRHTASETREAPESGEPNEADESTLTVDFAGEIRRVEPPASLTFGRTAQLVVDTNPFMHRVVGRVVWRHGVWWLQNLSSLGRLEVVDPDVTVARSLVLAPGEVSVLVLPATCVRFSAGPARYELVFRLDAMVGPGVVGPSTDQSVTATRTFAEVPFSPEQHRLLVALVDSARRHGGRVEASPIVARRLGWTTKKYHRKLDMVCAKLSKAGIKGLKGAVGESADHRRDILADHAVAAGLVDETDLRRM
jgi:hypothetical protein